MPKIFLRKIFVLQLSCKKFTILHFFYVKQSLVYNSDKKLNIATFSQPGVEALNVPTAFLGLWSNTGF